MKRPELARVNGREEIAPRSLLELLDETENVPTPVRTRLIDDYAPADKPLPPRSALQLPSRPKAAVRGKAVPFRRSRMFIAAFIITGIAMAALGFSRWYAGQVIHLYRTAEIVAKEREEAFKNSLEAKKKKSDSFKKDSLNGTTSPTRKSAPYADKIDNWGVAVTIAQIEGAQIKLTLRISNFSKLPETWPNWASSMSNAMLCDHYGTIYNRIDDAGTQQQRRLAMNVAANTSTDTYILFEAPKMPGVDLLLDFPIATSDRPFELRIQSQFIKRPTPPVVAIPKTPPPPSPKPKYDPERDPKLCAEIIDEYLAGMRTIDKQVKGKSTNNGTRFRSTETVKLRKNLAAEYHLEEAQINRILRKR